MNQVLLIIGLSFLLGAALNRGSTCAVLATEELLTRRRPARFLSFFEAALWGVLYLTLVGAGATVRPDWMGWGFVLGGGALFGLGAAVNGACAFGVVGRIGSGQIEYLLTAVGIFVGIVGTRFAIPDHDMTTVDQSAALSWPLAAGLLITLLLVRYMIAGQRLRAYWRLTIAMGVVGASFVALGQLHQPFPWVSALAHLPAVELYPTLAVVALLAGSASNAAMTGRGIRLKLPTAKGSVRRFGGGTLMGSGIMLVPGGNDSVLLYGMPAGELEAFAAYAAMIATIGLSLIAAGHVTETWKVRYPE
ncbi:YeeE/YedE family protein [Epibacterium sp. DP7N7-1]|nr:YeeE/YedE family protein [Epibacterium sp. DP7N7-1]